MAGLFRFNTTNNSTPKRRTTLSPFCTSPGQLQDVTMDNTYALGYRSPSMSLQHGGNASPGQGRSVREFEEQMASLRNENFNLKLRLYFVEQKVPGYNSSANSSSDGQESLLKQNVDLKVDNEILKKELQQKQSLLCEAAKAMELMEEQQKENDEKSHGIIEELNQRIQYLEEENKHFERSAGQQNMDQLMGRSDLMGDVDILQKVRELEGQVKHYEAKTDELISKQTELEQLVANKDESLTDRENTIKQLEFQIAELQEQLDEKAKDTASLEKKYEDRTRKLTSEKETEAMKLSSENKSLHMSLDKLKAELEREKLNFEDRNKKLKEQQRLMEEMQNTKLKEELYECKSQLANKICELSTVEERLQEKTTLYEKSCKAIQKLMQNTKELQHEVDKLKKSSGSQTMSYIKENTESTYGTDPTGLCDSNVNASTSPTRKLEAMLVKKDAEIVNLKQEVKRKTANLQTLINKELWEKNREIERLTKLVKSNGRTSSSPVREVDPLQHSFSDSDYIHALEQNKRLQLKVDKLIQKLSVVNERNTDQSIQQLKQQLREAREDAERAERWRKECADLCSVLTERLEELAGFLDSLLSHKDILGSLGADRRKAMRKAVERSLELSRSLNSMSLSLSVTSIGDHGLEILGNITSILDQTSDKENRTFNCLNEPANSRNNQVIESLRAEVKALKKELEKKKAPDSAKKERRSLPSKFDNQSESEAWSEPDRNVSMARIGLEESLGAKIVAKATKESGTGNTSTDSLADVTRKSKAKQHDKITQLEQIISQKENRILQAQCDLVDADNRLKKETLRRLEINDELEKHRKLNAKLEAEMKMLKEQTSNYEAFAGEVDQYKKQIEEKQAALDKVTLLRDQLTADIHVAESKMQSLSEEYDALKQNYEHDLEAAVLKEQEKMNAKEIELSRKYEEKLEQIENNHKEYLAREWISRVIYEQTKRELEDVQKKLTEAQFTVDFLRENETELNEQLIENEKQRRTLKQNLDEATLQSSKIVVERTKAVTEKLQLEAQLQELMTELTTIKHERDLILEQNNILHNQVMNATAEIKKAVKRTSSGSDLSHTRSGYTSEDAAIAAISRNERNVVQRLDNSSPDLGIESDAGRTSSTDHGAGIVENAYRAVLRPKAEVHPLNIVDEGGQGVSSTTSTNPAQSTKIDATNSNSSTVALETTVSVTGHDCARVDQENAELRRKVIRQKRALENTWNSLRAANQRKEQIEHGIRLQILKTQNVLNCVRTNIETELATPKKESPQK
ncbi:centrosomin isoform X2 [Hermetia illucens]|uniref:centrosomin isoform X2 n=1 Tax=Hermetia illucens TaxID=343691 RepID=UPI0018CC25B1|nr:centrosomin isoform X2 [Hermetia illucens]